MTNRRRLFSMLATLACSCTLLVAVAAPLHAEEAAAPEAPATPSAPEAAPSPPKPSGPAGPAAAKPAAKKAAAPATKGIQLSRSTPVASSVNVHDKVLSECDIQTMLPQMIAERASTVTLVDKAGGGNRLELKLVDIHAPNGGVFSGPKWITVEGRLYQGGAQKGDFTAKETSMGSATACGMLRKVMLALAGDIVVWMEHPTKNASLGRAR